MEITESSLLHKMETICLEEERANTWWIFRHKIIRFARTEFIDECNIQTIQQLPERICFPKDSAEIIINTAGIHFNPRFFKWEDILATGIKTTCKSNETDATTIMLGLKNGNIIERDLRRAGNYFGQVGHLIELYKLKNKRS